MIFNLAHETACSDTHCMCARQKHGVQEHDKTTGDRRVRAINKRVPASITLFPKGHNDTVDKRAIGAEKADYQQIPLDRVSGLIPTIRNVPEIAAALRKGEITITDDPAPEAPAEAKPAKTTTTSDKSRE